MFKLFYDIPGVVVLHDFFLGGILSHMESLNYASEIWLNELYAENGYFVSKKRFLGEELLALIHNYPCGYRIHKNAIGIIYHSQYSLDLSNLWYENSDISNRKVIPLLRKPTLLIDRLAVRNELKFKNDDFLVCSFGLIGPNKMSDRIIKNWIASFFATQKNCYLIFVGENQDSEYGQSLIDMITNSPCAQRIHITGWVDTETYQKYLSIANIGIQLRTHSRGETSAAVLDCMNYGISTIVNSNGSMAYLSNDGVFKLSDEFTDIELRLAIETLYKNLDLRNSLGERAREIIVEKHAPRFCADKYAIFIEDFYNDSKSNMNQLINRISYLENSPSDKNEWLALSESIANTFPSVNNGKQLIIDISSIVFGECSIDYSMFLLTMIEKIPKSYRIEPVYFSSDNVYRYARKYTFTLLSCLTHSMEDDVVEYVYGDLFFSIAPTHNSIEAQKIIYDQFKAKSIPVYTMLLVYDDMYHIELATHGDGTICISTDIKILLENYLSVKYQKRIRPYKIELLDYTSIEKIEDRVEKIIDIVTNLHWSYMWIPDGITRFFGSDCLFGTQIGLYNKTCIDSTNTAGYLLFGPYISMPAGNYRVSIKGNATVISSARMDVAVNGGGLILGESLLSEADINGYVVSLFITLERPCSDLEIRVWVDKESVISIALIEIIPEESEKYNQDHVLLITETNVEEEAQELKESNEVFIVKNEISEEDVN
jgi:glycosyltransferase involved in cell wall biosynthesis